MTTMLLLARELSFASRAVTSIEINGTFYGSQKPSSFRKWAEETPDDFIFSLKGPRFATNRKKLAEAGESIERFLTSGVTELGPKLGPLLWQMAPTKKFEEDDFAAFLALLPRTHEGHALRHVVEVRHESFRDPSFVNLQGTSVMSEGSMISDVIVAIASIDPVMGGVDR
jgi:uncharacterized protein YecE (DUF72 family)